MSVLPLSPQAQHLDLADPENRYRLIAESSRDVIWVMDLSMRTVYMSPSVYYQLGYNAQEYMALPMEERLPAESIAAARRIYGELLADLSAGRSNKAGASRSFEMLHRHKDGRLVWGEVSVAVLFDDQGRALGIHGITRDIEERKLWERALRGSEEKYRRLIEMLPIGVFECDLEGRISYVNDALFRTCGYERSAPPPELYIPRLMANEEWPRIRANMARLLAGEKVVDNEYYALKSDGSSFPVEVHASVFSLDGVPLGFRGVIIDVSDKKRYEAELRKANKLEAVGLLAGGIAHDFNNILAAVMGNINLASLEAEGNERLKGLLREAEKAVLRARGLTQQLLTFSRGGAPIRESLSVEKLVREIADFNVSSSPCRCEIEVEGDLPRVCVDRDQFGQVVQNLVINAVQAMPGGGLLRILLSRARKEGETGDWLELRVEDEGPGVPLGIRERIFDPYFTTKSTGTGLGLAVSFSIVHNHGGEIRVGSSPSGGASFLLLLPAAEGVPSEERAPTESAHPRRSLRILFVDDEESLRILAAEMASRAGYLLSTASSAEDALETWEKARKEGAGFDLVILDLKLKGSAGGLELFNLLREREPGLRALMLSGYATDPAFADWRERGFVGVLRKPYGLPAFIEAVERAFERRPPASSC